MVDTNTSSIGEMSLNVSSQAGSQWSVMRENLQGNIYHSAEWAKTLEIQNQRALFFSWQDKMGNCIALAIGTETWSRIPLIGRFVKHLSFESYPVVKDNSKQLMQHVLRQISNFAKKSGHLSLTINSYLTDIEIEDYQSMGFVARSRLEFVIDLSLEDDAIFKNFSTRHKRKVKKAKKNKLILKEAESLDAMHQFRALQVQSRDRRIERGESMTIMEDDYYEELGKNYFNEKLARVFLLNHEDKPISAAFVSIFGGQAYYVYGGSSDEGFQMDAPPLLFLQIFARCRELGCKVFNLGGVSATAAEEDDQSHGLYMFKTGFGGKEVRCQSLSNDKLRPILSFLISKLQKLRGN